MFTHKRILGLAAIAIGIAVAAALPSRASRVETAPAPVAVKGDRLDIRLENPTCLKASWPYGCGWQAPTASRVRHRAGQHRERSSRGVVQVSTWKRQLAMPSKRVF
jgi:hypothetical protein